MTVRYKLNSVRTLRDYRADFDVRVWAYVEWPKLNLGSKYRWEHNGHVGIIGGKWR